MSPGAGWQLLFANGIAFGARTEFDEIVDTQAGGPCWCRWCRRSGRGRRLCRRIDVLALSRSSVQRLRALGLTVYLALRSRGCGRLADVGVVPLAVQAVVSGSERLGGALVRRAADIGREDTSSFRRVSSR